MTNSTILQLAPRLPGTQDGVGDYAHTVARKMQDLYSIETTFATAETALEHENFADVILHYVNYGYQKRGAPFGLLSVLRDLRQQCRGRFLTIFHELYASGPPWKSAFWLRPFQMQIARSIAQISDLCIVSCETMHAQLKSLRPVANTRVHPVFSNFGEPTLAPDQLGNRSPHRWVICGGTGLVERSVRSFRALANRIPEDYAVHELFVLGGNENPATHALLADLLRQRTDSPWRANVRAEYRPQIAAADVSQILSSCSFAWIDYFHRPDVPTDVILKSSAFAAICAHGVIPIFPHRGTAISIENDRLPGPFFIAAGSCAMPLAEEQAKTAMSFYNWYQRHAASEHLAHEIANALGLAARQ